MTSNRSTGRRSVICALSADVTAGRSDDSEARQAGIAYDLVSKVKLGRNGWPRVDIAFTLLEDSELVTRAIPAALTELFPLLRGELNLRGWTLGLGRCREYCSQLPHVTAPMPTIQSRHYHDLKARCNSTYLQAARHTLQMSSGWRKMEQRLLRILVAFF